MTYKESYNKANGRLIYVDDLMKVIDKHTYLADTRDDTICLDDDISIILDEVPTAETFNVEPARWIKIPVACYGGGTITEYGCPKCDERQVATSNFCPNCGYPMKT